MRWRAGRRSIASRSERIVSLSDDRRVGQVGASGRSSSTLSSATARRRRSASIAAIVADAVEPSADPRVGRPRRGVFPEPDQRVLHGVLGLVEAAEHAVREAEQARRLAVDQPLESGGIAGRDRADLGKIGCAASSCLANGHLALNDGRPACRLRR